MQPAACPRRWLWAKKLYNFIVLYQFNKEDEWKYDNWQEPEPQAYWLHFIILGNLYEARIPIQRFLVRNMKINGNMEIQVIEDDDDGIIVRKRIGYDRYSAKGFKKALLRGRKIAERYEEALCLNEISNKKASKPGKKSSTGNQKRKTPTTTVRRKRALSIQERRRAFSKTTTSRSYREIAA
jgi:hypothetical protein